MFSVLDVNDFVCLNYVHNFVCKMSNIFLNII